MQKRSGGKKKNIPPVPKFDIALLYTPLLLPALSLSLSELATTPLTSGEISTPSFSPPPVTLVTLVTSDIPTEEPEKTKTTLTLPAARKTKRKKRSNKYLHSWDKSKAIIPEGCESIENQIRVLTSIPNDEMKKEAERILSKISKYKINSEIKVTFGLVLYCIDYPQGYTIENLEKQIRANTQLFFKRITTLRGIL